MLECKNCGAPLYYDILEKDLACSKCDSHFKIGEAGEEKVALADSGYPTQP